MPAPSQFTERQAKWFESVRNGLERETGRSLDHWAELARACPEQAHRARLVWMKTHHGLGQNHASIVLNAAFPPEASWSNPALLENILWSDPQSAELFAAVKRHLAAWPEVVIGQRKSFTAFSRKVQFAAARPLKPGALLLGIAIVPGTSPLLARARRESWSERLKSVVEISHTDQIDYGVLHHLRQAWEMS